MRNKLLRLLILIGIHGHCHAISHCYVDLKAHKVGQVKRQRALEQWCHDMGLGA